MKSLSIEIAPSELSLLDSLGLKIALSRGLVGQDPAGVVWKAIALAPSNLATWGDSFGFYASPTPPRIGTVVAASSKLVQAVADRIYTLNGSLVFIGPSPGEGAGTGVYAVDVRYTASAPIAVGLIQSLSLNGTTCGDLPLAAQASANPFRSTFEPLDVAYLSLRSDAGDGLVFSPEAAPDGPRAKTPGESRAVVGPLSRADFTLEDSLVASYDAASGRFLIRPAT